MSDPVVLVLMGVSGTGKSTVARSLAERLGWPFAEGDDLHPAANVAKMAGGEQLTDDDRWPWLDLVAAWVRGRQERGERGVVTCSALKRRYRDRLRGPGVVFVHLKGDAALIDRRIGARTDHFMPASLLASQLADLEPLGADERGIEVDVGRPVAREVDEIIGRLGLG